MSGRPGPHGRAGGEVFAIYVDPACQGLGAGRRLLEAAARQLAEAGFAEASLWVLASNRAARGFYESQGWRRRRHRAAWTYHGVGEGSPKSGMSDLASGGLTRHGYAEGRAIAA